MSKRSLLIVLLLLPLATGTAVIAAFTSGSPAPSVQDTAAAGSAEPAIPSQTEDVQSLPRLKSLPSSTSPSSDANPPSNDAQDQASPAHPVVTGPDEAASTPMFASVASAAQAFDSSTMPFSAAGPHSARRGIYTLSGHASGSGAGRGAPNAGANPSGPSGSDEIPNDSPDEATDGATHERIVQVVNTENPLPSKESKERGVTDDSEDGEHGEDETVNQETPTLPSQPEPDYSGPIFADTPRDRSEEAPVRVPEPASLGLFGLGLLGCLALRRRKAVR